MATPKRKKKGDGKKPDPKKNDHKTVQQRALNDVHLSIHPLLAQLARQMAMTRNQFGNQLQRSNSLFGQEQAALAPITGQYKQGSANILGNLQQALAAFGGTSGGNAAENAAAGSAMDAGARGALGVLGAGQSSDLAALQAAQAGAGMQKREMGGDILGNQQDALQQIMMQRQDVLGQMPAMIAQRLDQLRQQGFENKLSRQQFKLNKRQVLATIASNNALSGLLPGLINPLLGGGTTGGGGGGGLGGGLPGGGGGGNNPGGGNPGGGGVGPGGNQGGGNGGGQSQPPANPLAPLLRMLHGNRQYGDMTPQGQQVVQKNLVPWFWDRFTTSPNPHYVWAKNPNKWYSDIFGTGSQRAILNTPGGPHENDFAAILRLLNSRLYGPQGPGGPLP